MNPPPQVQDLKVSDLAPLVRGCPKLDVGTDASGPRTIRLRIEIHVTVFSIVQPVQEFCLSNRQL